MRKDFEKILYKNMSQNKDIFLITGDLGYGLWDKIRDDFPERFINTGSSEMAMMGIAIGLAMENKIPFVYSITPFAIYRPFEMLRNYINHETIPVAIVGGGRGRDYGYLGFSHWCEDDKEIMKVFTNINSFHPETLQDLDNAVKKILIDRIPAYLNLKK